MPVDNSGIVQAQVVQVSYIKSSLSNIISLKHQLLVFCQGSVTPLESLRRKSLPRTLCGCTAGPKSIAEAAVSSSGDTLLEAGKKELEPGYQNNCN